jgi:hypothetical protein
MVVIQKQMERSYWANAVLGLLPDAAIAVIAALLSDSGVFGFFVVLIGLQFLYLLIWLKNTSWMWIHFWVTRGTLVRHFEQFLLQNRFPRPPQYVEDTKDYLNRIAENDEFPCALRLKAAVELGTIEVMRVAARYQRLLQLNIAYDEALKRYAAKFPPSEAD